MERHACVGRRDGKAKPIELSLYSWGWRHVRLTKAEARLLAADLLSLTENE